MRAAASALRAAAVALLATTALASAPALAQDGRFWMVAGDVVVTRDDGGAVATRRPVTGDPVGAGDRIDTGPDGRAQIRFSDGSIVSLQPGSRFGVVDYRFDAGAQRGLWRLTRGALRTLTGAIGKRDVDDYKLITPTATIGVRGTEFVVEETVCDPACSPGRSAGTRVAVTEGRVVVGTRAGLVEVAAGGIVHAPAPDAPVVPTDERPVLSSTSPGGGGTIAAAVALARAARDEARSAAVGSGSGSGAGAGGGAGSGSGSGSGLGAGAGTGSGIGVAAAAVADARASGTRSLAAPRGAATSDGEPSTGASNDADASRTATGSIDSRPAQVAATSATTSDDKPDDAASSAGAVGAGPSGSTDGVAFSAGTMGSGGIAGIGGAGAPSLDAIAPNASRDATGGLSTTIAAVGASIDGRTAPGTAGGSSAQGGTGSSAGNGTSGGSGSGTGANAGTGPGGGTGGGAGSGTSAGAGTGSGSNGGSGSSPSAGSGSGSGANSGSGSGSSAGSGSGSGSSAGTGSGSGSAPDPTGGTAPPPPSPPLPLQAGTGLMDAAALHVELRNAPGIVDAALALPGARVKFDGAELNAVGLCYAPLCMWRGTQSIAELGGDGIAAWGRWTAGVARIDVLGASIDVQRSANTGIHYLVGIPTLSMPTSGSAAYSLAGATQPTLSDGSRAPGSFTADAVVQFAPGRDARVALDATVRFADDARYRFTTAGGLADPSASSLRMTAPNAFRGTLPVQASGDDSIGCARQGGCRASVSGAFLGPGAARLGVGYTVSGGAGQGATIDGVGVLRRNP